jgi:hypothetical protein
LLILGVVIIVLAGGQLAWAVFTSPDPNPNPVGNGMLMMLGWWIGGTIAGIGMALAAAGFATRRRDFPER